MHGKNQIGRNGNDGFNGKGFGLGQGFGIGRRFNYCDGSHKRLGFGNRFQQNYYQNNIDNAQKEFLERELQILKVQVLKLETELEKYNHN